MALIDVGKYTNYKDAIFELGSYKTVRVDGDTAATNIPVSGITTKDTIQSVIAIDPDNATAADQVLDVTDEASITSDGNIQLSTTDTTGYDLLVSYWPKPAWRQ